jgi:hypothetical protein
MAANSVANVPLILKELWEDEVEDYQYKDKPWYAMIPKDTSWSGIKNHVTVKYANGASTSSKFSVGKNRKRTAKFAAMEVETADLFTLWSIDNKLKTLTRDQKGSLVRIVNDATEDAMKKHKRRTTFQLWRNGGGAIAKLASGTTGTTLVFENLNDVRNIDIGDPLEFSNDDGRAGAGVLDGVLTVTEIDEDTGSVTVDASIATITGLGTGDFDFHEGDYGDDDHVIKGVPAYVCLEEPGTGDEPAAIWGMPRTAFPTRLGGHRFTPSGNLQVGEAVMEALTKCARRSIDVTHIFCSPEVFNEFGQSLEGQRRYADTKVGNIGFTGHKFASQTGREVEMYADPDIPLGPDGEELVFFLNKDTWVFHTAEEWPMWLTGDGKRMLVEENANAIEGRLGGYGNSYTRAAGQNGVLLLG